jgi:hypothetical protein
MTKEHYKLIGKLYAGVILINSEAGFGSEEVTESTTEEELTLIVQEAIRQGYKLIKGHESVRNMGTLEQIAKYVEDLYYY